MTHPAPARRRAPLAVGVAALRRVTAEHPAARRDDEGDVPRAARDYGR
ncbi:hypothetical protein JRF79_11045, partial [Micrococcus luteus]|nr:hypothetical protein [Micrococcus luteus]